MLERRFCNWIVEHCCGSKETTAFRCRRLDSRGTYKFSFVQAYRILYFFHLQSVACREAKSTWLDFWGIFHSRTIFAIATQSSQHFTFLLPCVCFLASSWNNVFSWFFSFEIHVRNNAQFASNCLISGCWLFYFVVLYLRVVVVRMKFRRPWVIQGNHILFSLFQPSP